MVDVQRVDSLTIVTGSLIPVEQQTLVSLESLTRDQ